MPILADANTVSDAARAMTRLDVERLLLPVLVQFVTGWGRRWFLMKT